MPLIVRVQIDNPEQATPGLTMVREFTEYTGVSAIPSIGSSSSELDVVALPLIPRKPSCESEESLTPPWEVVDFQRFLEASLRNDKEILRELAKH